jgi:NAD(P)H-hydrate epimerase
MHIYTSKQIKEVDAIAEQQGMLPFALMENAGSGLFRKISAICKKGEAIAVLAGKGNNGGDGIVLTRYLKQNGYSAELIFPVGEPKTKESLQHLTHFKACGFEIAPFDKNKKYDWIIDCLLGAGSQLPVRGDLKDTLGWIRTQESKVISVDLPTGVASDTGDADESVIKADYTFAIHGFKPSCFLFPSSEYYGIAEVVEIGLSHTSNWRIWTEADVKKNWLKRGANAHKGTFGTGLLIAGSDDMPGSAALCSIGAIRFGIGKLMVSTTRHASAVISSFVPEATFTFLERDELVQDDLEKMYSAVAMGPGLHPNEKLEQCISTLLEKDVPLILDAGALMKREYPERSEPVILTPHPGEFSRLLERSSKEIQSNRIELASQFAQHHKVHVVLKGEYTVIAYPDGSGYVNTTGNASLAKGGTGDTLTGILLSSLCNHVDGKAALANAVFIHGLCSDVWVEKHGAQTLAAHDFSRLLPDVCHRFERGMDEEDV